MLSEYRPDYVHEHGVTVLEQTEHEVLVGRWRQLPETIRRSLETYHGKRVVSVPVDPADPAVSLAIPRKEDAPEDSYATEDALSVMGRRTRNLPPGEALVRRLVGAAVERNATDLTLWRTGPYRWTCTVRVTGEIQHLTSLEDRAARAVIRLLKINAGLDLMQEQTPQDGRLEFVWLPGTVARVATVGDASGESLALRFLERNPPALGALGFDPIQLTGILSSLSARSGLILCCGATGSGKTTTVAAMAALLARNGRKVVSVEDPVEYRVPGVLQLHSSGSDRTYLPAALRQDPDVLWIGEVRRRDHAAPLVEAILSGHLVLTTVHAANQEGAIHRLADLGVSRAVVRQQLILSCTQRLEGNPVRLVATLREHTERNSHGCAVG